MERTIIYMGKKNLNSQVNGFTLVELMIALLIGSIVIASVYTVFISQHRSYNAQENVVEMQQNLRVSMDMLVYDIRSAGYDPNNLGAGITVAGVNNLTFTREDDDAANGLETISYSLFDAFATTIPPRNDGVVDDLALQITTAANTTPGPQPVVENISRLEFRYLDKDTNVTATLADIRSIQISILVVANRSAPEFTNTITYTSASGATWGPFNDNFRRRLLITTVQCRNLGL